MKRIILSVLWVALLHAATQYSYDALGCLTKVVYSDGTTIAYTYDATGNRLSQVISNPAIPLPKVGIDKSTLTFSAAVGQTSGGQAIAVTNAGGGSLQWNAVATANWLSVTPASGTNTGAVNVIASAAGMTAGTYNASVMILASASNPSVSIPVIFTVTASQGNPTISSGGIVSAAGSSPGIARGSVASLFGTSLADGPSQAGSAPLPRTLGNTQVAVNGVSAPLWYADSNQINFQMPFEAPLQGQASVVVTRSGVPSSPMNVTLRPYAPSVFTYARSSGVYDPIIVHAADNQLVTPTDPAVSGEYLVVYGTGIGDLTVVPATDAPSPTNPPAAAKVTPTATIGGVNAPVAFAGLTPGGIGLAQFNIQVPGNLPAGSALPLVINFNGATSAPVNLALKPTVLQQPNVTLQLTDVQPQSPLATDNLTLNFAVKNPGRFQGNLDIRLYVSQSSPLNAGTAQTGGVSYLTLNGTDASFTWSSVTMPSGLNPGTYSVAVGVGFSGNTDPNGVVLSSAMQVQIISQRPPFDLAVQLKDVSPTVVGAGDPIAVHYSVSEPSGISGTFSRAIYLSSDPANLSSGTLVNTRTFDLVKGALDLNSTGNSIPRGVAAGNYYIGVTVQTSGDTNPANNTSAALPITVTSQRTAFDIGVKSVSAAPSTIAPSGTLTVTYNITNTSKSTGIYNRWVYLSSTQTISTSNQLLSTGTFSLTGEDAQFTTAAITLPASVAAGTYYIGVIVESQGDTNPGDNISSGFAVQVGSSAGANAVSSIPESRSNPDGADQCQDSRAGRDSVIADVGGSPGIAKPKIVTGHQ